jgi:hypothetical protein
MIFVAIVGTAFFLGARKALKKWEAEQSRVFVQQPNRWRN